ncbi:MAG TPA: DJ-1/PfpI family protein [Methanospirillum sp.]|nr:DJ-1/PfpI family protein [Methanospirillum sp.]
MKILIAIPPTGYHDKELSLVLASFDHNKAPYEFASIQAGYAKGTLGGRVYVPLSFEDVIIHHEGEFDALTILGGHGGQNHFWNSTDLIELVRIFRIHRKVIGAISTSPVVLAKAGILKKRPATVINGPPIRELLKADVKYEDKPVVFLDRIVTARNPEDAKRFAELIIEYILGNPEFNGPQVVPAPNKLGFDI